MSLRIVVSGAGGQVGEFLTGLATRRGHDVLACTSAQWDITDPLVAAQIVRAGDVVVNCAAYTAVDDAQSEPDRVFAVNATGPKHIAAACAQAGAGLVHISTDYVFSGVFSADLGQHAPRPYEPADPTGPLSVYGRTKLAGEIAVLEECARAVVVRTAWVYTGDPGRSADFVGVMARLAAGGDTVEVVDDQIGSPTYVADLAEILLQSAERVLDLSRAESHRVLHAANEGAVSRYEQARAVFAETGADPQRVRPIRSGDRPRPAARPPYSALSSAGLRDVGLRPPRPWRDALRDSLTRASRIG